MSLYGYKLSTTPNIDAFAHKATVFTNFYSRSTFTTPCIATMITGLFPSETPIYQIARSCARHEDGIASEAGCRLLPGRISVQLQCVLPRSKPRERIRTFHPSRSIKQAPCSTWGTSPRRCIRTRPIGNRLDENCDLILFDLTAVRPVCSLSRGGKF